MTFGRHKKEALEWPTRANTTEWQDSQDGRVGWLQGVDLFAGIAQDRGAMDHIARIMEFRSYEIGYEILAEGAEGLEAYFLMHGRVRVQKSIASGETFPVALLEAEKHPFFGEAALLAADRRMATIVAETSCGCLILSKASFETFAKAHPEWALPLVLKIGQGLVDRLHRANNDVVLLYDALVREVRGEAV